MAETGVANHLAQAALSTALEATGLARRMILAECARPDGPRGDIGHCPVDDEAEWIIRDCLLAAFPTFGYLGEETGARAAQHGSEYVWIVDPNDGTSTMQRGYRGHAISIGLICRGIPVLGVVCAVDAPDDRGDLIAWAEGCGPVRRNGRELPPRQWSPTLTPNDIVGLSQGVNRNPVGYLAGVSPARAIGMPSIAYRLALVAVGDYAATVSLNELSVWDYAAGHALVRGAGGVVVDAHGHEITYPTDAPRSGTQVFAGARAVTDDLIGRNWTGVTRSGFGDAAPPLNAYPIRPTPGRLIHDPDRLSRAQGCLLGQIAGDALGALVEFESAATIARRYADGGPRLLGNGGPHRIIAGQPTDDSELALLLARALVTANGFDAPTVATAYAGWYHAWTHSDSPESCAHRWCRPFDVGATTRRGLVDVSTDDARSGAAADKAISRADTRSQSNGALMRISPLGIWGAARKEAVVAAAARADARLTHPHQVCQDASAVFAVTVAAAVRDGLTPVAAHQFAVAWSAANSLDPGVQGALVKASSEPPDDFETQQGWVLIALQNAFFRLLSTATLEQAVVGTVRAGGDTDTNAAICGALAGAVYGRDGIPPQWQRMVLSCRPMPGLVGVEQPRPALYWPTDSLILAERLLDC